MSEILNFDSAIWEELYDKIIIPQLGELGKIHKKKIVDLYESIRGRWWTKNWKMRLLYSWENWYGKASYEMKQELKVLDIILQDINTIQGQLN